MYCSTFTDTNQIKTISREILVDLARILTGLLTFSNPSKQRNIYISSTILPTYPTIWSATHSRTFNFFTFFKRIFLENVKRSKNTPSNCSEGHISLLCQQNDDFMLVTTHYY